ncbi:MAG TPA: penicillin-binding protein 2 [bacterium]|nr:penicillin-binding protein 2 [bacterium]
MAKKIYQEDNRIKILCICFFVVSFLIIIRLFIIQILKHSHYLALAEQQHWIVQDIPAERGKIFSADGALLASNIDYYLLYAEPLRISEKADLAKKLSELLSSEERGSSAELFSKYYDLLDRDLWWVALESKIDPVLKKKIEEQNLEGIGFEIFPVRYYPEKTLASHVLGFIAQDDKGERVGYFGVEGYLDGDLRGKPGKILQEKDAFGNPILIGGYDQVAPIPGRDVFLTIDRSVQYIVEKSLKEAVEKYGAESGTVIVMNPLNGQVIAMANYPWFDPANLEKESDAKNLAISDVYEPGSVMKPFTVSAGLDTGKISPNSVFVDSGPVIYSDYTIDNWDGKHHGTQDIAQLLQKSNNIGAAWVGHLTGSKELYRHLVEFGFGKKTGVDLEGEDTGIIRPFETWTDIDLANISFGQGISATPLQVLNAFNVFANGGYLYRPQMVYQISTDKGVINLESKPIRRVLPQKVVDQMHELLISAVDQGESKFFNIEGYKIAGKTGTAQIPKDGKYDPSATNATFLGYLANSKRYSMLVRLERPKTSYFASETAVPLWMDITRQLVSYYSIPPDNQ